MFKHESERQSVSGLGTQGALRVREESVKQG